MMKLILASSLLLISATANAVADARIWVRPSQCAIEGKGSACTVEVTVKWQLTKSASVCLHQNHTQLVCLTNQQSGQQLVNLTTSHDVYFTLIEQGSGAELASITFPLLHPVTQQVHRRKVPWRIML